jgi:hypothetical protein
VSITTMKPELLKRSLSIVAAVLSIIPLVLSVSHSTWFQARFGRTPEQQVTVVSGLDGQPIRDARVEIDFADGYLFKLTTSSSGTVSFHRPFHSDPVSARMRVKATGYEWSDSQAEFSPQEHKLSTALAPIRKASGSVKLLERAPYDQVFNSPEVGSRGSEFSAWMELRAAPPLPGYEIDLDPTKTYFALRGDRACNAWSECVWRELTPQKATFQFRVQGHSEWLFGQASYSQGFLHVTYVPSNISLLIHLKNQRSEQLLGRLRDVPFFKVETRTDNLEAPNRLEYFTNNSEDDALRLREAVFETLSIPVGSLPLRKVDSTHPANYFELWFTEPAR